MMASTIQIVEVTETKLFCVDISFYNIKNISVGVNIISMNYAGHLVAW